jgi:hypothetical protein
LRRIREGVITSAIGLGATFFFYLIAMTDRHASFLPALGVIVFLIGLGLVLNGLLLTVPKLHALERSRDKNREELLEHSSDSIQNSAPAGQLSGAPPSVTELTTHNLSSKPLNARQRK